MTIVKRMLTGGFWAAVGGVVGRVAGLASAVVVARMLGTETFAEFSLVRTTVMTLLTFGGVGIGTTATRFVAQSCASNQIDLFEVVRWLAVISVVLAFVLSAFLYFGADMIATSVLSTSSIKYGLQLGALAILFTTINTYQTGVLAGFEAFRSVAILNVGNGLFTLFGVVVGAYYAQLAGAILGMGVAAFFSLLLGRYLQNIQLTEAKNYLAGRIVGAKDIKIMDLVRFCVPVTLGGILVAPVFWTCNAILVRSDNGLHQVALYEAANQWRMMVLFVPVLIAQVSLPIFSSVVSKNDFLAAFKLNVGTTLIISLAMAIMIFFSSEFILGLYGNEFREAANVLRWLSASAVLMAVNYTVGQAIAGIGRPWHGFLMNAVWAVLVIWLSWLLVGKEMGAIGIAIAQFLAYGVHTVIQLAYALRFIIPYVSQRPLPASLGVKV